MIPNEYMTAYEWAYAAWGQRGGPAVTVPADALTQLIQRVVTLEHLNRAFEEGLKVTVECGPKKDVDTP